MPPIDTTFQLRHTTDPEQRRYDHPPEVLSRDGVTRQTSGYDGVHAWSNTWQHC